MNLIESIALGIIQGTTEFLPISSSGHLYLIEEFLHIENSLVFALYLHIGTLLAVVWYYRRDINDMLVGITHIFEQRADHDKGREALLLGLSTIMTFPTGFLVYKFIDNNLSLLWVGITLIITAGLISIGEYIARKNHNSPFSLLDAIILGLVQGISVFPGISRSGMTISTLLFLGVTRQNAARLSFLLSIPTIAGAGFYIFLKEGFVFEPIVATVGIITSFMVGYASIAWMTRLVQGKWLWFVPYCLILGSVIIAISFV